MANPIAILSTDWHIKSSNKNNIVNLVRQKCELAKSKNIKVLICLGDVFDSRVSQRLDTLLAFSTILNIVRSYDMSLFVIPGNHDKTRYDSIDSFLDPFKDHPSLHLIREYECIQLSEGIQGHFIPFFQSDLWLEKFNSIVPTLDQDDILFSHMAVDGSMNNDGSLVKSIINPSIFGEFMHVFLGHYHNMHSISDNVHHIPSIQQNNYGEDDQKGFIIIYDDCDFEFIKSEFKEYKKIKIEIDGLSKKKLDDLRNEYADNKDYIRFEFYGDANKLKSIDKTQFTSVGIDVKTKSRDIEKSMEFIGNHEPQQYTFDNIKDEFANYCEENDLDVEFGMKYLNQIIDQNGLK